jgi:murein L,D-transpeptidase YcbB/YkuD
VRARFVSALVVPILFLAAAAAAQEEDASESELLRARVELLHEHPEVGVRGVRIAARRALPALYERRGFRPAWGEHDAREELLRAVRDSAADGLDPEDYLLSTLEALRAEAEAEGAPVDAWIDYDLLLTDGLARLLYHLVFGKVDPREFDSHWNLTREIHDLDPASFLQEVIDSGELHARVESEKPSHRLYTGLRQELARHREQAALGGWPRVPPGPTLEQGAHGPRVAALRARLEASGDLAPDPAADPQAFDAALEAGVRVFQTRHGIDADGRVGRGTQAALDVPIEARIEQIRVNLERGRWLLHDLAPTLLIVNVAGFRVYLVHDGELAWSARAVVGKPYRKTPLFRSELTYLVLNPTWTVPPTILAQDILPAQRRDPGHLDKKRLRVIDAQGRVVPTHSIDWANATAKNFRYALRQDPGPDNALGRVKFMFPNSYAIYLHDTPSRNLFERSERTFSSGCIRVENPLELAALLLEGQPGWSREAIDRVVAEGKTKSVPLSEHVPVVLAYWTAWVDLDGRLQLRNDVYARDVLVARGLAEKFSMRRPVSSAARPSPLRLAGLR